MNTKEHLIDKDKLDFEKREFLSGLFDFYGPLLSEKNQDIYEKYIIEDYGISEIAHETGGSRQAVYEVIRRVEKKLISYEEKLKLYKRFEKEMDKINKIKSLIKSLETPEKSKTVNEIIRILDDLF